MRLSTRTQEIIRDTAKEVFGPDVTISVFGSRIDDETRGGDIDLVVQSDKLVPERQRKSLQLVARLQIRLGDQPIDVLVIDPNTVLEPVHEIALRTGVTL